MKPQAYQLPSDWKNLIGAVQNGERLGWQKKSRKG